MLVFMTLHMNFEGGVIVSCAGFMAPPVSHPRLRGPHGVAGADLVEFGDVGLRTPWEKCVEQTNSVRPGHAVSRPR